jgi:hypothetical protein
MRVKRDHLEEAARAGLLAPGQVEPLWEFLGRRTGFDFVHLAYYAGALLIIGAFSVFSVGAWETLPAGGQVTIASLWMAGLLGAGVWLHRGRGLAVPGGLLVTCGVCVMPLLIYSVQRALGLWGGDPPGEYRDFHLWIRGGWLWMELGTLAAGLIALRSVRFAFLTFPVAFVLWYLSMDLTPILFGHEFVWEQRKRVSVAFGLIVMAAAFFVDRRTREDFAFWLYLAGLLAFSGGLSLMDSGSWLGKLVYLALHAGLLAAGVLLGRRVFLVFGALGVAAFIGDLAWHVFDNALGFSFALAGIGLALIFGGIQAHKHQPRIEAWLNGLLPARVRQWLPARR